MEERPKPLLAMGRIAVHRDEKDAFFVFLANNHFQRAVFDRTAFDETVFYEHEVFAHENAHPSAGPRGRRTRTGWTRVRPIPRELRRGLAERFL